MDRVDVLAAVYSGTLTNSPYTQPSYHLAPNLELLILFCSCNRPA